MRSESWADETKRRLLEKHIMPLIHDDVSKINLLAVQEHWAKVNDEEAKECKKCHDTAHLLSQNMLNEIEKEASE